MKKFTLFLKKGETDYTTNPSYVLPGKKSRSRLVYNPKGDLIGVPGYISEWILRNLARIMPGFCYKETNETLTAKFEKVWKKETVVFDLDAKANDANQHFELR